MPARVSFKEDTLMSSRWISVLAAMTVASAWGCGGDDGGGNSSGGTGGAAGSATGGAAGSSVGGTGGTGTGGTGTGGSAGSATGGSAGSSTGGTAGASTGGAAGAGTGGAAGAGTGGAAGAGTGGAAGAGTGGGSAFWPNAYNANGLPNPSSGQHHKGDNCLTCHTQGGQASGKQWLFGGTVYKADKTTAAPHVEVGVKSGSNVYTTYSANNGNFWLAAGPTVNWGAVEIRIRNSNGEKKMSSQPNSGGCNSCHTGTTALVEP
jgi:hypothetical protein